jgi:hypothetical protein
VGPSIVEKRAFKFPPDPYICEECGKDIKQEWEDWEGEWYVDAWYYPSFQERDSKTKMLCSLTCWRRVNNREGNQK